MTEESDDDEAEPSIDSLLREAGRIAPRAPEPEPDRIGQQLGRYRIDEKLGQGAMGVVYGAEDLELGRRVALKVLPRAAIADVERKRRFVREARAAAAVSHPNLATVFDVGEAEGTVFLAMELVRGTTLRSKIAAAPDGMPEADAIGFALQIARGLGKAHASGIVHRDLKPENVMIDANGVAKVVDFGLAKLTDPEPGAEASTQEGRILGTPSYMAPEQAKGLRVGPTADVFSLGVVLYEMSTGRRPFGGDSLVDVLVAIARDAPAPPSRKAPRVSRELDRVVLRSLSKAPADRYADGAAVATALEAIGSTPKRRWPWVVAAFAGIAIALGAGVVASTQGTPMERAPIARSSESAAAPAASASVSVVVAQPSLSPSPSPSLLPEKRATPSPPPLRPATSQHLPALSAPAPSVDPLARQK